MMAVYEVILHTHVGRQYIVEADDPGVAFSVAMREYMELGEDGEVLYDSVEDHDVTEVKGE